VNKGRSLDPRAIDAKARFLFKNKLSKKAINLYKKGISLHPKSVILLNNLGNVLFFEGKYLLAIQYLERALKDNPSPYSTYLNLANAYRKIEDFESSIRYLKRYLKVFPANHFALNDLGVTFHYSGNLSSAILFYKKSIALSPGFASAHFNLSCAYLASCNWKRGWEEYEWRLRLENLQKINPPISTEEIPLWKGERVVSQNLLIFCEQGFGDTIQFIRYFPILRNFLKGKHMLFVPKELYHLFKENNLDPICNKNELYLRRVNRFDFQVPLMSLPKILTLYLKKELPRKQAYLAASTKKEKQFQNAFSGNRDLKIGLAWQGNPSNFRDRFRSVPLKALSNLFKLNHVKFFSIQKKIGEEQLLVNQYPIESLSDKINDFSDLAACIMNLDLIITVDTAVAHLSGSLGKKTWVLLSHVPDWRWGFGVEGSIWYPSLQLMRKKRGETWGEMAFRVRKKIISELLSDQNSKQKA
jgi:hypothetical protein